MINLKKIAIITFLLVVCFSIGAQSGTPIKLEVLESKIVDSSKGIQTLKGPFAQNKLIASLGIEIESRGLFYYKKTGDKLRWEYTSPTQFVVVFANGEFKIKQFENIDSKKGANQLFTELNKIILNALKGNISVSSGFSAVAYENKNHFLVQLKPASSDLKGMINSLEIYFRKTDYSLSTVKIFEPNTDITTINFNNITSNITIPEKLFE